MAKVWVLQHIHCETLGAIANILESAGLSAQYVRTFEGQSVPEGMGDAVGLIVMGGPMGVYEHNRYPFLLDEMQLIGHALEEDKPVLGVCLGSQLLAAALGAAVTKGKKREIGWYPVTLADAARTDPLWTGVEPSFVAYHWHGDIFELPQGAVSLASSGLTQHQAFRYGRNAYGFLFHMEVTERIIGDMVKTFADELQAAGVDGHAIVTKAQDYLPHLQGIGRLVFQRWTSLINKDR